MNILVWLFVRKESCHVPWPHWVEQCLYQLLVFVWHILHNLDQTQDKKQCWEEALLLKDNHVAGSVKATYLSHKRKPPLDTWCRRSGNGTEETWEYRQIPAYSIWMVWYYDASYSAWTGCIPGHQLWRRREQHMKHSSEIFLGQLNPSVWHQVYT